MIAEALAAAAHRLGVDRDAVLARIGGELGEDARAKAALLAPGSGGDSRRLRAEWAARARVPMPAGLRGVHATWIEAALVELPERARAVLAGGDGDPSDASGAVKTFDSAPRPTSGDEPARIRGVDGRDPRQAGSAAEWRRGWVDVWFARRATAGFVPLPPTRPGPPRTPRDIAALGADDALRWLAEAGLDQLAHALAGPWIATAAASLGAAFAMARTRIATLPRAGALGPQRAALERCVDQLPFDGDARVIIGARTVAPYVSALARRALALRIARPLGEHVFAALDGFARADPARGPTWIALAAAAEAEF